MRRLALIAAALVVAGCVAKRPAPPPPPPPPAPEVVKPKPQPRAKPAAPAALPEAKADPAEACRSLALQRASDAKSLGRDAKAQAQIRNETYADCMSGRPVQ